MPKVKKNYTNQYTVIANNVLRDKNLSWKAKGVFAYLWSLPDNWNYKQTEVMQHATDGLRSLRASLDELENAGYLTRKQDNQAGKFGDSVWTLNDSPILRFVKSQNAYTQKSTLQSTNKQSTNITNYLNKDKPLSGKPDERIPYKEIIDYLNQKAGTHFKNVASNQKFIKARFHEGQKLDDFKKVIDIKWSDWGKDPKMNKYIRPATLFGTKFDTYLNEKPKQTRQSGQYQAELPY